MIALFPYLWLADLTRENLTASSLEFLDNVSNTAPGDTNEDDLEGLDVDKDKLLGKEYLDPWRTPTGSCEKWTVFNT